MTQDEIIEMARDSGMDLYGLGKDRYRFVHHLETFAKLVAAKEREACADLCMEIEQRFAELSNKFSYEVDAGGVLAALQCVNAIRARGEA